MESLDKYNNLKKTIIVMVGIPGSGKSTVSNKIKEKNPDYIIISRDLIREKYPNYGYTKDEEYLITQLELRQINEEVSNGSTIIIDDTNCYLKIRKKWEKIAFENDYKLLYHIIMCTPEKAMKNIENRDRKVPKEVIDRMYNVLINNK